MNIRPRLSPEKIKEMFELDPFIKYWGTNYKKNLEEKVFNWERSRPLIYLKNTIPYKNIPIVLVSAGPSLDKNIHILKEYQDRCIICCVDVVLFKLIENDIQPDYVINIDPHPEITVGWKDIEGEWLDTSGITLVCPTTANYESLCAWKGNIIFYNQSDDMSGHKGPFLKKLTKSTEGFGYIGNSFFIGATMLQFVSIFNPKIVILMGYDFAYTDDKVFCHGILQRRARLQLIDQKVPVTNENIEAQSKALEEMSLSSSNLGAKINEDLTIKTTELFKLYLFTFKSLILKYKLKVINSTEGGIFVDIPNIPLSESLKAFCTELINKVNGFSIQRKRKRRR